MRDLKCQDALHVHKFTRFTGVLMGTSFIMFPFSLNRNSAINEMMANT